MTPGKNPGGKDRKPLPGRSIRMQSIKCPTCGKEIRFHQFDEVPYLPFCGRKCKLLDLGKWFDEEHRISTPLSLAEREGDDFVDPPEEEYPREKQEEEDEEES